MSTAFSPDDMAEIRQQGDLKSLFAALLGKPAPHQPEPTKTETPDYHIARPGAWPCGTAPSGPVPSPCCSDCEPGRTEQAA
ncbi:hypothetical protein [Streptomyces axinellae]|uniref:Uncharacterized protein n=1 Tax=Streptomyces axinellae TaxID=552788 RepID=A0ABN3QM01_9ACTN